MYVCGLQQYIKDFHSTTTISENIKVLWNHDRTLNKMY